MFKLFFKFSKQSTAYDDWRHAADLDIEDAAKILLKTVSRDCLDEAVISRMYGHKQELHGQFGEDFLQLLDEMMNPNGRDIDFFFKWTVSIAKARGVSVIDEANAHETTAIATSSQTAISTSSQTTASLFNNPSSTNSSSAHSSASSISSSSEMCLVPRPKKSPVKKATPVHRKLFGANNECASQIIPFSADPWPRLSQPIPFSDDPWPRFPFSFSTSQSGMSLVGNAPWSERDHKQHVEKTSKPKVPIFQLPAAPPSSPVEEKFGKYFGYLARCDGNCCTITLKN